MDGLNPLERQCCSWIPNLARALLPALLLLAGCYGDRRITVARLEQLEQADTSAAAVPVEPKQLGLTDFHPYRVRPGDILSVRMIGLLEDRYAATALELRVHDDGQVFPPVVNPVKVEGLTLADVERTIHDAYVPTTVKNLSVFVELAGPETTTVLIQGAGTTPGLVKLRQNERNLFYALVLAAEAGAVKVPGFGPVSSGGFGPVGSGRVRLRPIRPEREEVVYDLRDVNDVRRALLAEPLESGDVLEIEASDESAVYVTGLVQRSGPIMIPPASKLSVLQAVMAAGGLRDYLDVKEATLVRNLPSGEPVHVKLDLGGILAGRTPDLALKPGDILQVPYTVDTFLQEWFFRNMMPGPFNIGLHYDPLAQYNAQRALQNRGTDNALLQSIRQSLGSTLPGIFVPPVPTRAAGQ